VRCLSCHYDPSHLTEHRCPECGRAFDPNDPNTLYQRPLLTIRGALLLYAIFFVGFSLGQVVILQQDPDLVGSGVLTIIATGIALPTLLIILPWCSRRKKKSHEDE
jgi:hypothetical protein